MLTEMTILEHVLNQYFWRITCANFSARDLHVKEMTSLLTITRLMQEVWNQFPVNENISVWILHVSTFKPIWM